MRKWILPALVVIVLLNCVLLSALLRPQASPARTLYAQVHQGRPISEANAVLGPPDVTMPAGPDGRPLGYSWAVEGGRIFLFIDDQNTVISRSLDEDNPSLLTIVQAWLEWE